MLYMSQESTYMLLCIVTWVVQIYFLLRPGIWVIPNLRSAPESVGRLAAGHTSDPLNWEC